MTKTGDAARPTLDMNDSASVVEVFQRHQRTIVISAVVLLAVVGGLWMSRRSGEIKEQRATEALAVAETAYSTAGIPAAQVEMQKLITRYAGTSAATQAAMISAQWSYEADQPDSGLVAIAAALPKAPRAMRAGLLALQAMGKGMKGDHAGAAADFEAAAGATQLTADKDGYLMEAARSFHAAGDNASAERLYGAIAAREDSQFSNEARLRLSEIKAKA
jgi:predicted negative regulator of RcsB-dependent stress response